jgi:hypothetical protein
MMSGLARNVRAASIVLKETGRKVQAGRLIELAAGVLGSQTTVHCRGCYDGCVNTCLR